MAPATTIVGDCRPCSKCRLVLPVGPEHFHRNSAKAGGYSTTCKECFRVLDAKRNAEAVRQLLKKGHGATWYKNNAQKKQAQNKKWKGDNRPRSLTLNARSRRKRLASDPLFATSTRVSSAVRRAMHGAKGRQAWQAIVGYSAEDLRAHLQRQFTGKMSWDNYGTYWQIDHIVPIRAYALNAPDLTSDEVVERTKACWALSNLRPLHKKANQSKGGRRTTLL